MSDSKQISAVPRGFDNAVTYATLCKILRDALAIFVPVTINFFNSALGIGSTGDVTPSGAAQRDT